MKLPFETTVKNLVIAGAALVVMAGALYGAYTIWSLSRENARLAAERDDLSTQILNHQIEATVHGSAEAATSGIKTATDASNLLNNYVNRRGER